MSDTTDSRDDQAPTFLQRWSRRKQEQAQQADKKPRLVKQDVPETVSQAAAPQPIPDIDTLHEDSEVSIFFTEQVSETLKRMALRKLFHMDKFNVCDGLDDYAEDYTRFEPLGEVITAHQRLREERESLNRLAKEKDQEAQPEHFSAANDQLAEQDSNATAQEEQAADSDETPDVEEHKEG